MKKLTKKAVFLILVSFSVLFIIGCKSTTTSVPTENGVARVFSKTTASPGETINVKLYINLLGSQRYYIVDEGVPTEIEIIKGDKNKDNHIKLVEFQNVKSNVYGYTIKAPSQKGVYTFTGEFNLDGMDGTAGILGNNQLTVK